MKLAPYPESGLENEPENLRQDALGVGQNFAWLDQHHNGARWAQPRYSGIQWLCAPENRA